MLKKTMDLMRELLEKEIEKLKSSGDGNVAGQNEYGEKG